MNLPDALAAVAAMDAAEAVMLAIPGAPTAETAGSLEYYRAESAYCEAAGQAEVACIAYVRTLAQPDRDAHLTDETVSAVSGAEAAMIREAAAVQVDEAMVERAEDYYYDNSPFNGPDELREGIRQMLIAALAHKGNGE